MFRTVVATLAIVGASGLAACTIEDEPDLAVVPAQPQVVVQPQPAPMVIERRDTVVRDRVY